MKKIVNWKDIDEKYGALAGARATLIEELQFRSLKTISSETGLAINTLRRIIARESVTWDSMNKLTTWSKKTISPFNRWIDNNGEQKDLI